MNRLGTLNKQLTANKTKKSIKKYNFQKNPNDVVICICIRTPLTKAGRGLLKDANKELLLKPLIQHVIEKTKIDPKLIEDVVMGNVLDTGAGMYVTRLAEIIGGIPYTCPVVSVNRFCASGLEAINMVATRIIAGQIEIGLAGGFESMSVNDMNFVDPQTISEDVFEHEHARNCLLNMGQTSEKLAERYDISRKCQDEFGILSQQKAVEAQEKGYFKDEILPITVPFKDKDGNIKKVLVSKDDGIRKSDMKSLGKLKTPFKRGGSTTAGNSSQMVDGAAVALVAKRSVAEKLGLPIIAKFVDYVAVGVDPEIMGVGPLFAIPKLLERNGLTKDDIDIFEINEAFASQSSYCIGKLGLDKTKVNPKGGAIALGHPLGCTGVRLVCTLLPELKRQNKKFGIASMCVGTGMGAAALIQNEQN